MAKKRARVARKIIPQSANAASVPQCGIVNPHLRTVPPLAARCSVSSHRPRLRRAVFRRCGRPLGVFHNSVWSFRIARKLACGSPYLIGLTPLLRPQGARFVRPSRLQPLRGLRLRTALRSVCSPLQPFGPPMFASSLAAFFALLGLLRAAPRTARASRTPQSASADSSPLRKGSLLESATSTEIASTKYHCTKQNACGENY